MFCNKKSSDVEEISRQSEMRMITISLYSSRLKQLADWGTAPKMFERFQYNPGAMQKLVAILKKIISKEIRLVTIEFLISVCGQNFWYEYVVIHSYLVNK